MIQAKDFGAVGVAFPRETMLLANLQYKWIRYHPGTQAVIYHPRSGVEFDSAGIQRAIDAAHSAGGGTVVVPAGNYLIAPIELKSRVRLHLEPGACLWGSPNHADYHDRNLLYAENAEDIALTGEGQISGQVGNWVIPWMNAGPTGWNTYLRPKGPVFFHACRRVKVEGIRIVDSPAWTLVFHSCDHVNVHGVRIHTLDGINSDGIDLVDTSNATISNCDIHCTDDGICLKNDRTHGGGVVRNIAVSNCVIRTLCNGVKIGTETTGIVQDVTFNNIVVHNPSDDLKGAEGGINLCSCDGGLVRNVSVNNLLTRNVECAFYLVSLCRTKFQQVFRTPRPGQMERISLTNIRADGTKFTSFVVGHPGQPIRDLFLANIDIRKTSEFRPGPFPVPVPACNQQYPNPFMFGSTEGGRQDCGDGLPAYSLYLRDAVGVRLRDFRTDCAEPDGRDAIVQENCHSMDLRP